MQKIDELKTPSEDELIAWADTIHSELTKIGNEARSAITLLIDEIAERQNENK